MTKRRDPLTAHRALTTVAGLVGWDVAARIVRRARRTLLNWSDPDTKSGVSLAAAIELDLAYAGAGGDGYPLLRFYQTEVELRAGASGLPVAAVIRAAGVAAKEHSEAVAATYQALAPGATAECIAIAVREAEESLEATAAKVQALKALRDGDTTGSSHG